MLDVERPLADLVFFGDFLAGRFEAFFAAERFFAALPLFAELVFLARFFGAVALVAARRDLRAFFPLRFLTVFLLAIATTIPFSARQYCWGLTAGGGA